MKFISYPLSQNLDRIVQELAKPNSILVFPTLIAAQRAEREYLRNWDLSRCNFYSVEELRSALILPQLPIVTDEKRLLCLYMVMEESERDFFHIYSYSDIVEWGRRFFDFFEELCVECIEMETLEQLPNSGIMSMQEWQEKYLEKIIAIRNNYFQFISSLGFSDAIFYLKSENIIVPWQGCEVIYINQYYYSALEKKQIEALEDAGNQVTIVTHGLEISGETDDWKVQDFDLKNAWNSLECKPVIEILETENETQMALSFLSWNMDNNCPNSAIIDSSFHLKSYSHFFPEEHFAKPDNYPFSDGTIYKMLSAIYKGLKASKESDGYLPVRILANYISEDWFCHYFFEENSSLEREDYIQQLRLELSDIINKDTLYVNCAFFNNINKPVLQSLVLQYNNLMEAFTEATNLSEICSLIDSPNGLCLIKLLQEHEKQYTDIIPVFWTQMANFMAIENLGLINSWKQIFEEDTLGENLLDLLLNYLKSAKISIQRNEKLSPEWEISNLLDSRNRAITKVAFFQMIEGIVPSNPTPVWLFNESQRAKLGLKTYNDVRKWERYYFFRLLLCSEQAICLSYANQERDISPSSFLGELEELLQNEDVSFLQKKMVGVSLTEVYSENTPVKTIPELENNEYCCVEKLPEEDFFIIPSDPMTDFPKSNIRFSASALIQFMKNPFLWYVENKCKLYTQNWEAEETISYKLFGNIMHSYFSTTLSKLTGRHISTDALEAFFGNSAKLEAQLREVITSDKLIYKIPKNYNAEFLGDILAKKLAQSLYLFYKDWLKKQVEYRTFDLYPETDDDSNQVVEYKKLGTVSFQERDYLLYIGGRADLRVELDNKAIIVDFKTGSHDYRQLCIYEWYYYLLDEILPADNVSSLFWNILDPTKKTEGVNEEKRQKLKEQIFEHFTYCLANGYSTITKVSDRQRLQYITRADLLREIRGFE